MCQRGSAGGKVRLTASIMQDDGLDQPNDGRFVGPAHRLPLRVFYEDTDLSGVVYHANYLRFMERARSAMLKLAGIDQRTAADAGQGGYAVTDLAIRYLAPARLGDALVVESAIREVRAASVVIQQTVSRAGLVLARARVTAAWLSPAGRPLRQPPAWIALYRTLTQGEDQGR